MPHFVYIVECADGTYYTGWTTDLKRRINQHNQAKKGAHYTKIRRPVKLVYKEKHETRSNAMSREYEIKQKKREDKEDLIKSTKDGE